MSSNRAVLNEMTEERRVLRHETTIRRAIWPPLIALCVLAATLLGLVYHFYATAKWVQHSSETLYLASRSLRLAVELETNKRGFLLDGDSIFLQQYNKTLNTLRKEHPLEDLIEQTADNPSQQQRAREIKTALQDWIVDANAALSPSAPASMRLSDDPVARAKMDEVRTAQQRFVYYELQLKDERVKVTNSVARWALFGGSGLTVLVGGFLAVTTRRQLRMVSQQYESALDGETRVRERLATTLTSIGDGVLVTDAVGRIMLLNPVSEALTGWTDEEARGKLSREVFDIRHEETGDPVPDLIELVIRENRTVLLANHTVLKQRDGTQLAIEDSAAPVRDARGNVVGVVLVFRDVTERKRQDAELATALEKNRRIAETLQRSMLNTPPEDAFPGLLLATLYEPASDEALVGGDFLDVFTFWGDQVAFVVGDATGKGLDAAATTSEVKYALRTYLHDNPDPAQALTRLNRFLAATQNSSVENNENAKPLSFVSLAVAVVDRQTGEGMCAVAGADPPLLLRKQGTASEAAESGIMLGAAADATYDCGRFRLAEGDAIAFTTDGITEARRGRRDFFGYERFTRVLEEAFQTDRLPEPTPGSLAALVLAQAKSFAGGQLNDDVCLLIARRESR